MLALVVQRTKRNACHKWKWIYLLQPVYFVLLAAKGTEKKDYHFHEEQEPRPQLLLSGATFFQLFKNSHTKHPGSHCWQDAEKKVRQNQTKNSNICSRLQPDSLMWITQHFVPWPWRTKRRQMPQEWSAMPWEASVQWALLFVSLSWSHCPLGGAKGCPLGASRHHMPLGLS